MCTVQVRVWCGIMPLSPDDFPMIGRTKSYNNLYLNVGHGFRGENTTGSSYVKLRLVEAYLNGQFPLSILLSILPSSSLHVFFPSSICLLFDILCLCLGTAYSLPSARLLRQIMAQQVKCNNTDNNNNNNSNKSEKFVFDPSYADPARFGI